MCGDEDDGSLSRYDNFSLFALDCECSITLLLCGRTCHLLAGADMYAITGEQPAQCQSYLYGFFYELYVIVSDPFTKAR